MNKWQYILSALLLSIIISCTPSSMPDEVGGNGNNGNEEDIDTFILSAKPRVIGWGSDVAIDNEGTLFAYTSGITALGVEADGYKMISIENIDNGECLRISYIGDLYQGTITNLQVATKTSYEEDAQIQPYTTMVVDKISTTTVWFTLKSNGKSDIRIVTDMYD